jgi:hypothetical protein
MYIFGDLHWSKHITVHTAVTHKYFKSTQTHTRGTLVAHNTLAHEDIHSIQTYTTKLKLATKAKNS